MKFIPTHIMTKNQKVRKGSVQSAPATDGNIKQLSLFDSLRPTELILTTKQVQQRYKIPDSELKNCHVKEFLELSNCVLLHIGHNKWKVKA